MRRVFVSQKADEREEEAAKKYEKAQPKIEKGVSITKENWFYIYFCACLELFPSSGIKEESCHSIFIFSLTLQLVTSVFPFKF